MASTSEEEKQPLVDQGLPTHHHHHHSGWGTRHTLLVMIMLGSVVNMLNRSNLPVAIVAMINASAISGDANSENSSMEMSCPLPEDNAQDDRIHGDAAEFDWNSEQQGVILGSYGIGLIVGQLPGGAVATRFGGKWVYGLGTLMASLMSLVSPIAARTSIPLLTMTRVIQGFSQGVLFVSIYAMIPYWTSGKENNYFVSLIWGVSQMGIFIGMTLTGIFSYQFGWTSSFYIFGGIGVCWFIAWCFLAFSKPCEHPRISKTELDFLNYHNSVSVSKGSKGVPYLAILSSSSVWVLFLSHAGCTWGYFTFLNVIPTYLSSVQHISLQVNGVVSSAPYLLTWAASIPVSAFAHWWLSNNKSSKIAFRKVMSLFSLALPGFISLGLTFAGCNANLVIGLLALNSALGAFSFCSILMLPLDLSPTYSSILFGLSSTFACMGQILGPYTTGFLTPNPALISGWNNVFYINMAANVGANIILLIFGKAEREPWDKEN